MQNLIVLKHVSILHVLLHMYVVSQYHSALVSIFVMSHDMPEQGKRSRVSHSPHEPTIHYASA
jgi:hypothetical protein